MASSNRNWPSLFKSKPHLPWQHDLTHLSAGMMGEERSPEPKPRWNPRPEQIRVLEAIFDSGMVNPPRDEIRRIRAHLQLYGPVGDANVFYWFQNRKSRRKLKPRLRPRHPPPPPAATSSTTTSERSTGSNYFQSPAEVLVENACSNNLPGLWTELMMGVGCSEVSKICNKQNPNPNPNPNYSTAPAAATSVTAAAVETQEITGESGGGGAARSTVFINGMGFEVIAGPFNVMEVFGGSAVLVHASGHPVLTDEWGLTLHPLQHGASYFLI